MVRTYFELNDKPDPSNTMIPRTHGSIFFRSTVNLNETYKLLFMKTRRILKLPRSD